MQRKLGRSGIDVSAVGMGCWAIGGPAWRGETPVGWGQVDDDESVRALHKAVDLGVNFFDTANVYGAGHSERVLGRAFHDRRDKVVIATKFNSLFNEETKQITGASVEPDDIRTACDESLARMQTDYIDLYQLHAGGLELEKAAEVRDTLEALVEAGKIRSYGWSTDDAERAQFFGEGEHCTAIQLQLNVLRDNPETVDVCEKMNMAAVNRGPLAMGILTGKYTADSKLGDDDVRGENAPAWMRYFENGSPSPVFLEKLAAIRDILTTEGRSLPQGALAWLWARSDNTVPIPGFKTVAQVEENAGAMQYGPLTADQLAEIDRLLERE